ncbi:MAG TPA: methyltransferase domain-containing protein [Gemmatimonadaceae bacterium]|jgi:SAM-dependent methyltransferase|nr:methyltransferase domain-containing protein [Gemmatimonadaceae bacterium]
MPEGNRTTPAPAVLRLVQMAIIDRWRATGEDLYREVARLADLEKGQDIVVSGCGRGVTTEWLALRTGASVTGVDPDDEDITQAEEHARDTGLGLSYQHAKLDDLPYENGVFDAAIGEPEIAAAASTGKAVAELARVTKPMGSVVLLQLTWSSELSESRRELVVERLGLRPRMVVEWKQMLREAGVVDIQVKDWTNECDDELAADGEGASPRLNWQAKMQIMGRALRRSGWAEARQALVRETELLRDLSRERSMNFSIIKGVKWPHAMPAMAHG